MPCRSCFQPCMAHLSFMHACIMQARRVSKPREPAAKRPRGSAGLPKHACKIASTTGPSIQAQQVYLASSFVHGRTCKASHHVCMYQVHVIMLPSGRLQGHLQVSMHVHVCMTPSFGGFGFQDAIEKKMPKPPSSAPPPHLRYHKVP